MNQVHLASLGCRLNEAELERWARDFHARGWRVTGDPEAADLLVVNTCAVTREAARKSRNLLRRAQHRNPRAKLVVSGCYATLEPDAARAIEGVDLLVDNRDKEALVDLSLAAFDASVMPAHARLPGESSLFARGRSRAFVKVQDGCRHRCTFCIVTVARGEERSRPLAEVLGDIRRLVAEGVKEAVLTGVHLGAYRDGRAGLPGLAAAILADTDLPRLRFGSVEPWDLDDAFLRLFDNPRLLPHLHLPLQSGSDAVLRRMARRARTGDFARLVEAARGRTPRFNVSTDVIVGFPGETESEWRESMTFIEAMGFAHIHVFPYSPRPGTRAARMPDQVPPEVIRRRCRELHGLSRLMKRAFIEANLGDTVEVLWEAGRRGAAARCAGYTPNFLRVEVAAERPETLDNTIVPTRLARLAADGETIVGLLAA
jgi:threonylcarbamoyladenosine tRNA methylthiotransferase MtaB